MASLLRDCATAPVGSGSFIVGSALVRKWREKNNVRIDSMPRPQHSWHQALRHNQNLTTQGSRHALCACDEAKGTTFACITSVQLC